ncbi:MAG: helix-turn-helix domain-containing protein [Candidatus Hodarchaeota archaeon]
MKTDIKKFDLWYTKSFDEFQEKEIISSNNIERALYWADKIKESDVLNYKLNIENKVTELLSKGIPKIYNTIEKYLIDSEKHRINTKIKRDKILRFVYHFSRYLLPLTERIEIDDYIKEKLQNFIINYLPHAVYDVDNIDEFYLRSLLKTLYRAKIHNVDDIDLDALIDYLENILLNKELGYEVAKDLLTESESVEFKSEISRNTKIGKEIAAFASKNGGKIYIGIDSDGNVIGLKESYDEIQIKISNIITSTITPVVDVYFELYELRGKNFVQINILKGNEPVYYYKKIPYIRVLSTSRPANPEEVKLLHKEFFNEAKL